jgi:competence protein ComEC
MPLFWSSLAFLAGICLAAGLRSAGFELAGWVWLAIVSGICALAGLGWLARRAFPQATVNLQTKLSSFTENLIHKLLSDFNPPRLALPVFILLAVLALGAARYQFALPDLDDPGMIASYTDRESDFVVIGVLAEPPDMCDSYTNLRVRLEQIRPSEGGDYTPVEGLLLAQVLPAMQSRTDWRYGDRVLLEGRLETPPEDEEFSYRDYLARQGVYSLMPFARLGLVARGQGNPLLSRVYTLKERALQMVYRLYPDPEASLLAGILLGVEGGIPPDVKRAFQDTGTAHVIAISGFNIAIIGGLFATLFLRLLGAPRRFLAAGLSAVVIAFYALLVGAGPSVVRAAIMGVLSLFAVQLGRRQDGLNSLAVVAAVMLVFSPFLLWDVSFQLSFMATLGLVVFAGMMTVGFANLASRRLPESTAQRLARPVGEYVLFTLAALVTTLPVIAYHFGRLSLTALIANPLILPAQPPVMVLGGLAVALGLIYEPIGQVVAYLAWPFVAYTIRTVELVSRIPGGVITLGEIALGWVILYYAVLFLATFAGAKLKNAASVLKPSLVLAGLGALAVVVWQVALHAPDGHLHLTVLDVGRGDALLIQTPVGRSVLVDGGSSPAQLSQGLGRRLPLTRRWLDWLVVAGPGTEQVQALPRVLERFPAENVLWAGDANATRAARNLQEYLTNVGIEPEMAVTGQALDLGNGAMLRVLHAGESGAVLLLEWQSFRALLPVGMDQAALAQLLDDPALTPVTALLLADGGAVALNPPEWIEKLAPRVVLLSAAADAGGPGPRVLDALQGYTLLRTDRNGWIELTTDGAQMWVEVGKKTD